MDPSPFPSLRQIVRFQTVVKLEKDNLRKLTKSLFSGSKLSFLEDLVYPEIANKLHFLAERAKLGAQLSLAEEELSGRETTDKSTVSKTLAVTTSFSAMSTAELESWISVTKVNAKTPPTPSLVKVGGGPHDCLALPETSHFKFSFIKYNDQLARLTCLQMERTKFLYQHPINLSSFAQLGISLPLATDINALSGQQPLHSSDNVRESNALTPIIVNFIFFLSYGTYRIDSAPKNNTITIDCPTQTPIDTEIEMETESDATID